MTAIPKVSRMARLTLCRSFPVKLLFCLCLGASLTPVSFASSSLLHKEAPEFVCTDLKQQKLDLHAYRGKVVWLNFWATWCAPCQLEMPRFVAWQNQYGPRGLQIIGISIDDDPVYAPEQK